jgi:hypothetical protein
MVTTVKRGAGRPAATSRKDKAAQRTPLPPKPGTITDEMLEHAAHIVTLQDKTAVQLRAYAREKGYKIPGLSKMAKDDVLREILAAEDTEAEKPAEEKPKTQPRRPMGDAKATGQRLEAAAKAVQAKAPKAMPAKQAEKVGGNTKSELKAAAFAEDAIALGWTWDMETEGELTKVVVRRGEETLEISWLGGVFQGETCVYQHAGRTAIKVHNASAAKKRMAVPAEAAEQEARKVAAHKALRGGGRQKSDAKKSLKALPFTEASLDQEVLDALYGRRITWLNGTSDAEESDRVPSPREVKKAANAPKIGEGPRGRFITFTGQSGFRDVLISSITEVR